MLTRFSLALVGSFLAMALGLSSLSADTPRPDTTSGAEASSLGRGKAYSHLMRALFAVRRGEVGTATEEINKALEFEPESADLHIEGARLLRWAGRRSHAEKLARRALELDENHPEGLRFLAELLLRRMGANEDEKARREALTLYERLAEVDEDLDSNSLMMLAQLRHQAGDTAGAITAARKLFEQRPGDSMAARTLAQFLLRQGEEREALSVMLEYLAEHPFDEDILVFAEQMAGTLHAWPMVARILSAEAPFPAHLTEMQRFYGAAMSAVGQLEEAVDAWEKALEGSDRDPEVAVNLARAYQRLGRLADAITLFNDLREGDPDDVFYALALAGSLENQRDAIGAAKAYTSALESLKGRTDDESIQLRNNVRFRLATLAVDAGDLDEASRQMAEWEGDSDRARLEMKARIAVSGERWDQAREVARQLREIGVPEAMGLAAAFEGEVAVREGRFPRAEKSFNEAIEILGNRARRSIAETYNDAGRPERGEELLREWVEQEPDAADARYSLGAFLFQLERIDAAEAELREAIRIEPDHGPALNFLGYSMAEQGRNLNEALAMILQALEGDAWNGAYLDSLGWVYYQMGDYEQARPPLERAVREMPNDPTILEHLGDLYLRIGERDMALTVWDRALEAGPDDTEKLRAKMQRERDSEEATQVLPQNNEPGSDASRLPVPR